MCKVFFESFSLFPPEYYSAGCSSKNHTHYLPTQTPLHVRVFPPPEYTSPCLVYLENVNSILSTQVRGHLPCHCHWQSPWAVLGNTGHACPVPQSTLCRFSTPHCNLLTYFSLYCSNTSLTHLCIPNAYIWVC